MPALARHRIRQVFLGALMLSFHAALTTYINSTFLNQFFTEREVGYLYTAGALVTILGLIISSSLIRRVGNTRFILTALIIEIIALVGLYATENIHLIILFFILHHALPGLLIFSLDIFLEAATITHNHTGRIRSLYLTVLNIAFVFSPIITGKVVSHFSFKGVYLLSAFFCILFFFIIIDAIRYIPTHHLREVNFVDSIKKYIPHKDLNRLFIITFLLQVFYVMMVVYTPIYLNQHIGFGWQTIGLIFTVMLLPFVLFEAPLGHFFDTAHTEKDTLIAGFIIIALTTSLIFFIHTTNILVWMIILFMTRVGASFVEVAADYSFFRRVTDRDAGFISVFRMNGPLSYVIAPLLISPLVNILSIRYLFLFGGILMLTGIIFSYKLRTLR